MLTSVFIITILVFTIGLASPVFAMQVRFQETIDDGLNFYFIDHGATIIVDASLDREASDNTITTKVVHVERDGTNFCEKTFTETGPNTGIFTFPYYFMFKSAPGLACGTPAIPVSTTTDTTITAWVVDQTSVRATTIVKFSQTFNNPTGYQKNPNNQPTATIIPCSSNGGDTPDNDGICNNFETGSQLVIPYGTATYTYDCSPSCTGNTKDVFVEYDWLKKHKPNANTIQSVKDKFGLHGINLHVQMGEEIDFHKKDISKPDADQGTNNEYDNIKNGQFGTVTERGGDNAPSNQAIKDLLTAKSQAFHYVLFAHQIGVGGTASTASGSAEIPGNDVIITLGARAGGYGTEDEQAGTLMHELGHNLYLDHYGPKSISPSSTEMCKPNYLSVMNYIYQFSDYLFPRPLDYSSGNSIQLVEGTLAETDGFGMPNYGMNVVYSSVSSTTTSGPYRTDMNDPSSPPFEGFGIDWDYNGATTGTVNRNINVPNSSGCPAIAGSTTLIDYNDWANLDLSVSNWGSWLDGAPNVDTDDDGEYDTTTVGDGDDDGANDDVDNCLSIANEDQQDVDNDGYGAACDIDDNDVTKADFIVSNLPEIRTVEYTEHDSSVALIGQVQQVDKENEVMSEELKMSSEECDCPDAIEKKKKDIRSEESLLRGEHKDALEYTEHSTLEDSREARTASMQNIIDFIDSLQKCDFRESTNSESVECTDESVASEIKNSLEANLKTVKDYLQNDTFHYAATKLDETIKLANDGIKNPISRAQVMGMLGGAKSSQEKFSNIPKVPYVTLKESADNLKQLAITELWNIFEEFKLLIIILIIIIIAVSILAIIFRVQLRNAANDFQKVAHKSLKEWRKAFVST